MMKLNLLFFLLFLGGSPMVKSQDVPIPSSAQLQWQDAELVAVFHYDLHVFDGKKYGQKENRITPIPDYNVFNPIYLDTDQWIKAIKDAGFKIAILTVTHETGFALYQSEVNPYCLKAVKWRNGKGDIVKDFVKSCKKYGIKPGIYVGIRWNAFMGVHDFKVQGDSEFSRNRQLYYNKMCEGMVKELCANYGDWAIIWFDGGAHGPAQGGPDVLSIVEKYQPNCLFYHNLQRADMRWGGSESGKVPYPCWGTFNYPAWFYQRGDAEDFKPIKHGHPEGKYYIPAMADAPLRGYKGRHEWFWEPNDEAHIYPVRSLVDMYENSVGHNASLILGLTPNAEGLLPQPDADTLKLFGKVINNRFRQSVGETRGETQELEIQLPDERSFRDIVIAEQIEKGERIRAFSIQIYKNNQWESLLSGTCVGHKFIAHLSEPIRCKKIKLTILQSIGQPSLKQFAVY